MDSKIQVKIMETLNNNQCMIELFESKIKEFQAKIDTLKTANKVLNSKLNNDSGFGDSINHFTDGFGIDLK